MEHLICLFGKWYNLETLKYETYCTNNTSEANKQWQEKSNDTTRLHNRGTQSRIKAQERFG